MREVGLDRFDQFADACKASITDAVHRQVAEEALDEIDPRGRGGGEMHDDALCPVCLAVARVDPFDPALHLRMLVGGVVVDDEMQGEARGRLLFQMFDELQPFLVGVALGGLTENLAVQITEGGEQGDGAVADVVVSAGPHAVRPERQRRLGPFQRLTLAFFVTA